MMAVRVSARVLYSTRGIHTNYDDAGGVQSVVLLSVGGGIVADSEGSSTGDGVLFVSGSLVRVCCWSLVEMGFASTVS